MARLAKCSRQKFFRPIIATFRAPLDFEPVIILSCLIPLFFIVRAQKILSLSLFLFSFLLFLSSFFSYVYIYIYIKRNLTTKILPIQEVQSIVAYSFQNRRELYSLVFIYTWKITPFSTPACRSTGKKNLNRLLHFIRFRSTAHGSSFDESLSTHRSILRRANHPFFLFKFRAVRVSSSTTFTLTYLSYRRDPQLVSQLARCFPPTPNDSFVSSLSLSRTRTPSLYFFPFLSCSAPHPLSFTRSPSTHRIGQTGSGHH